MLRVLPASRATTRPGPLASCLILVLLAGVLVGLPVTAESDPPEISLSAPSTHQQVHPGGQASFMLTITNDAEQDENVTLDEASPEEVRINFLEGRTWSVPANGSLYVELLAGWTPESRKALGMCASMRSWDQTQANLTLTMQVVFPPVQIALDPSPWQRDPRPGRKWGIP